MDGKFGDKVIHTGAGGQEHLAFVIDEGDPATLVVFNQDGAHSVKASYRGKEDGQRDGAGGTYRAFADR